MKGRLMRDAAMFIGLVLAFVGGAAMADGHQTIATATSLAGAALALSKAHRMPRAGG